MYVEAPQGYAGSDQTVFLAGGITDCPDWQRVAAGLLDDYVVLNPRRADFDIYDWAAPLAQITWEFNHLNMADVVLFWFPVSFSVQPIALYELGRMAALGKRLAVGVQLGYARAQDVHIQLSLGRPDVTVQHSLRETVSAARMLLSG